MPRSYTSFILLATAAFILVGAHGALAQNISWKTITAPAYGTPPLGLAVTPGGRILLVAQGMGLYASDDRGVTWSQVTTLTSFPVSIAIAPNGNIVCGTETGASISTDGGATWKTAGAAFTEYCDVRGPANGSLFILQTESVYRSTDNGISWSLVRSGGYATAVTEDADGRMYVANVDSGVSRNDGSSWTRLSLTNEVFVRTLAVTQAGSILAGTQGLEGVGAVYRSPDHGGSWSTTTLSDVNTALLVVPDGPIIAAAANSGIHYSDDDGRNWKRANNGLLDVRVFGLALHPNGEVYAADVFGNMYRSTAKVAGVDRSEPAAPSVLCDGRTIRFIGLESEARLVRLWDAVGRLALEQPIASTAGAAAVDCSALTDGIYFHRIDDGPVGMVVIGG